MRIRLRPYHPTYVVACFGPGGPPDGFNRDGFTEVLGKIGSDPEIEVKLVEEYDDICLKCERRVENEKGSVWGAAHSCPSSDDPEVVRAVDAANRRVLSGLGLEFGSVVKLRALVALLGERIPVLDDDMIGGAGLQERYESGLTAISALWE